MDTSTHNKIENGRKPEEEEVENLDDMPVLEQLDEHFGEAIVKELPLQTIYTVDDHVSNAQTTASTSVLKIDESPVARENHIDIQRLKRRYQEISKSAPQNNAALEKGLPTAEGENNAPGAVELNEVLSNVPNFITPVRRSSGPHSVGLHTMLHVNKFQIIPSGNSFALIRRIGGNNDSEIRIEGNSNVATTSNHAEDLGNSMDSDDEGVDTSFNFEAPNLATLPFNVDPAIFGTELTGPESPDVGLEGFAECRRGLNEIDWFFRSMRDPGALRAAAKAAKTLQKEIATISYLHKVINSFEELNDMFLIQIREQNRVIQKLMADFKPNDEGFMLDFNNLRSGLKSSNLALSIEVERLKNDVNELKHVEIAPSSSATQGNLGLKPIQFYVDICIDLCEMLMRLSDEMTESEEQLDGNNYESLNAYYRVLIQIYELPNKSVIELEKAKGLAATYMQRH